MLGGVYCGLKAADAQQAVLGGREVDAVVVDLNDLLDLEEYRLPQ